MVTFDQLMQPLIEALVNLGGSGSIDEIYEADSLCFGIDTIWLSE